MGVKLPNAIYLLTEALFEIFISALDTKVLRERIVNHITLYIYFEVYHRERI